MTLYILLYQDLKSKKCSPNNISDSKYIDFVIDPNI